MTFCDLSHTMYVILCLTLDLYVPEIIAYLIERVVLFLYPFSFPIHSIQETSILEGVIMKYFIACLRHFLYLRVFFAIFNCFCYSHKQLYVKDSSCLVEAAIWEIAVCSTCWEQGEYIYKRDFYNGAFCSNSLQLKPTNSYYRKELYGRLDSVPKVYLFR